MYVSVVRNELQTQQTALDGISKASNVEEADTLLPSPQKRRQQTEQRKKSAF
jgi:hypothetical protein